MKTMHTATLRWSQAVADEIAKQGLPYPVNYILAIIDVESQGVTGLVNHKSGASGLMQVMPSALETFNHAHQVKFSIADMRAKDNPIAQIRVGTWTAGQFWRSAYHFLSQHFSTVPVDQIALIADLFYAMGPGRAKELFQKIPVPTYENFAAAYPHSDALPHQKNVFARFPVNGFNADAVNRWIASSAHSSVTVDSKKKIG